MEALNGKVLENYDEMITNLSQLIRIPGCYCMVCGETFALYPHTTFPPTDTDKKGVPYYNGCCLCPAQQA